MNSILVVGSVGYDTITTPRGRRENILGGSANYFSMAASLFAPVNVVGVVGDDYKEEHRRWLEERKVDLRGLQKVHGKTFCWEGKYEGNMNEAKTLATHLNVFEKFHPAIPEPYRDSSVVFLANIDPVLQLEVLDQVNRPRLIAADTMNYWIDSKKSDLLKVLKRVDVLLINEGELRKLTGNWNTVQAAQQALELGPKTVVIKRGEYGFILLSDKKFFIWPAFPVDEVVDPTGAGDTFAGGFLGSLAQLGRACTTADLKEACLTGSLLASFTVQDFGVDGLKRVTRAALEERFKTYRQITL